MVGWVELMGRRTLDLPAKLNTCGRGVEYLNFAAGASGEKKADSSMGHIGSSSRPKP